MTEYFKIVIDKYDIGELERNNELTSGHFQVPDDGQIIEKRNDLELFNYLVKAAKKYVYKPGDVVRGHVDIKFNAEMSHIIRNLKEIKVMFKGLMDLRWIHVTEGEKTRQYPRHKVIPLRDRELVVWSRNGGSELLPSCPLRFPFEFQLPPTMLGSCSTTFMQSYCTVFYYLDAIASSAMDTLADQIKPLLIERVLLPGDDQLPAEDWQEPSSFDKSYTVACSGTIHATVKLRNGIFLEEGKPVIVDFSIDNQSSKPVRKIKCRLKQQFRAFDDDKVRLYPLPETISKMKAHVNIRPRKNENLTLCLPLPAGQEPSIHKNPLCPLDSFIQIKYKLEVEVCTGHWSVAGPSFNFNVIIGSSTSDSDLPLFSCDEEMRYRHLISDKTVKVFKRRPLHGIRQLSVGKNFHPDLTLQCACAAHAFNFSSETITRSLSAGNYR